MYLEIFPIHFYFLTGKNSLRTLLYTLFVCLCAKMYTVLRGVTSYLAPPFSEFIFLPF